MPVNADRIVLSDDEFDAVDAAFAEELAESTVNLQLTMLS